MATGRLSVNQVEQQPVPGQPAGRLSVPQVEQQPVQGVLVVAHLVRQSRRSPGRYTAGISLCYMDLVEPKRLNHMSCKGF